MFHCEVPDGWSVATSCPMKTLMGICEVCQGVHQLRAHTTGAVLIAVVHSACCHSHLVLAASPDIAHLPGAFFTALPAYHSFGVPAHVSVGGTGLDDDGYMMVVLVS